MEEKDNVQLPENAFRELKDGESYEPLMSPRYVYPEVNTWSVTWGILMAILFSAAAAYLGLKVGQVFEAAIPIAIIAVGLSGATKRKNAKIYGRNQRVCVRLRITYEFCGGPTPFRRSHYRFRTEEGYKISVNSSPRNRRKRAHP